MALNAETITTIRSSFNPDGFDQGLRAAVTLVRNASGELQTETGKIISATDKMGKAWLTAAAQAQKLVNTLDGQAQAAGRYASAWATLTKGVGLGAVQIDAAEKTLTMLQQRLGLANAMLGQNNSIGLTLQQNYARLVNIFDPIGAATIKMATATNDLKQAQSAGVTIMGGYMGALASIKTAFAEASIAGIRFTSQAKDSLAIINQNDDLTAKFSAATSAAKAYLVTLGQISTASSRALITPAETTLATQTAANALQDPGGQRASVDALYASSKRYEAELNILIALNSDKRISDATLIELQDQLNARFSSQTGTVAALAKRNDEATESTLRLAAAFQAAGMAATTAAVGAGRNSQAIAEYVMSNQAAVGQAARGSQIAGAFNDSNSERGSVDALYASSVRYEEEYDKIQNLRATGAISIQREGVLLDELNARYAQQTGTISALIQRNDAAAASALQLASAFQAAGVAATSAAVAAGRNSQAIADYAINNQAAVGQAARGSQIAAAFNDSNAERASVDALYAASVRYEEEYDKIQNLRATGAITSEREVVLLDELNTRYSQQTGTVAALAQRNDEAAASAIRLVAAFQASGIAATSAAVAAGRNSQAIAEYVMSNQAAVGQAARGSQIAGAFNDSNSERASVDALYAASVRYEEEYDKIQNLRATGAITIEREVALLEELNNRYAQQTGTISALAQRNDEAAASALRLAAAFQAAGIAATSAAVAAGRNSQALAEYAMANQAAVGQAARGSQISGAFNDSNSERASVDALYAASVRYEEEYDKIQNLRATGAITIEREAALLDDLNDRYGQQTGTVSVLAQRNEEAAASTLKLAAAFEAAGIAATSAAVASGRNSQAIAEYQMANQASAGQAARGAQIAGAFNDSNAERASVDALYAASVRYEEEYNKILNLRSTGVISVEREASLIDELNARYGAAAGTARAIADADAAAAATARALADENARLVATYDPLTAAAEVYRKSLDDIATAQARGLITPDVAATATQKAVDTRVAVVQENDPSLIEAQALIDKNNELTKTYPSLRSAQEAYGDSLTKIAHLRSQNLLTDEEEMGYNQVAANTLNKQTEAIANLGQEQEKASGHGRNLSGVTSGLTREFIVLTHEIITGNWSRLGGSFIVLIEYMTRVSTVVERVIALLKSPAGILTAGLVAVAAALAGIIYYAEEAEARVGALQNRLSTNRPDFGPAATQVEQVARSVSRTNPISFTDAQASGAAAAEQAGTSVLLNADQLAKIIVLNAKLSQLLGETTIDAKRAGQIVADPAGVLSTILKANPGTSAFDQNLINTVKHLQEIGQQPQAVALAFEAMSRATIDVNQKLTNLGRAWKELGDALFTNGSNGQSWLQGFGTQLSDWLADTIRSVAALVKSIEDLKRAYPTAWAITFGTPSDAKAAGATPGGTPGAGTTPSSATTLSNWDDFWRTMKANDTKFWSDFSTNSNKDMVAWFAALPFNTLVHAALSGVSDNPTAGASVQRSQGSMQLVENAQAYDAKVMTAFWNDARAHSDAFWTFAKDTMTKTTGDTWHDIYNIFVVTILTIPEIFATAITKVVTGIQTLLSYIPGSGVTAPGSPSAPGLAPAPAGIGTPASNSASDTQAFITEFLKTQTQIKLNDAAIAAILTNVQAESGFNPARWNDKHTSYGVFQYDGSAPGGGRLKQLQDATGTNEPSLLQQLQFFLQEITTGAYAGVGRNLTSLTNDTTGARSGSMNFTTQFENPANAAQKAYERAANVNKYLPPSAGGTLGVLGGAQTPGQITSAAAPQYDASAVARYVKAEEDLTKAQAALNQEMAKDHPDPELVKAYSEAVIKDTKAKWDAVDAITAVVRAAGIETTGQTQLSAAWEKGAVAASNFSIQLKAEAEARSLAGGEGKNYLLLAGFLTEVYKKQAIALESVPLAQNTNDLKNQIEVMNLEISTIGQDANARALLITQLKNQQALEKQFPQQTAANTAKIIEQKEAMTKLTLATQEQQTKMMNMNEVASSFDSVFSTVGSSIVDAFDNGKTAAQNLQTTMTSVAKAILNEFIKLAVINPIMNSLFPSTTPRPTFGGAGGILDMLRGGGSSSSGSYASIAGSGPATPVGVDATNAALASQGTDVTGTLLDPNVSHTGGVMGSTSFPTRYVHPAYFDDAPRFHQGLASDEFPAILQRGERVLTEKQDNRVIDLISNLSRQVGTTAPAERSSIPRSIGRDDLLSVLASGEKIVTKYHDGGIVDAPDSWTTSAQQAAQAAQTKSLDASGYASLEPSEPGFAHLLWSLGKPFMDIGETARGLRPIPEGVDALQTALPLAGIRDLGFSPKLSTVDAAIAKRVDGLSHDQLDAPPTDLMSKAGMLTTIEAAKVPLTGDMINKGIQAFHGSAADFQKFSLEYIGTGEGAQAYSRGLYFAGRESIGKSYKETVGGKLTGQDALEYQAALKESFDLQEKLNQLDEKQQKEAADFYGSDSYDFTIPDHVQQKYAPEYDAWIVKQDALDVRMNALNAKMGPRVGDVLFDAADPLHQASAYLDTFKGDRAGALAQLDKEISWATENVKGANDAMSWYDLSSRLQELTGMRAVLGDPATVIPKYSLPGHMYEVKLNVDEGKLLDWDKPLSQQPQSVQEVLQTHLPEDYHNITSGGETTLVHRAGGGWEYAPAHDAPLGPQLKDILSDPEVVAGLNKAGIPGVRYLDAGSRTAGEGSHNYVMWDDANIEIMRKYGIAGLTGGGLAVAGAAANAAPTETVPSQVPTTSLLGSGSLHPGGISPLNVLPPDNPLGPKPPNSVDLADALTSTKDVVGKWVTDQRAEAVTRGLWNPDTGLPTQAGMIDGLQQFKTALMAGTTTPGIRAFHGSPADFDAFFTKFIGTGEGAQAFGRGLYFAEREKTAISYRDSLSGKMTREDSVAYQQLRDEQLKVQHKLNDLYDEAYHKLSPDGPQAPDKVVIDLENRRQSLFQERDTLARSAKDILAKTAPKVDGLPFNDEDPLHLAASYVAMNSGDRSLALKNLEIGAKYDQKQLIAARESGRSDDVTEIEQRQAKLTPVRELLADNDAALPNYRSPGHMYEVQLHVEQDHLLNWDRSFADQSPFVKDKLASLGYGGENAAWADRQTGRTIYKDLEQGGPSYPGFDRTGMSKSEVSQAASDHLKDVGITGIRYLDRGSRSSGEGSSNYVIFDESNVEILRKYGIAGLTGGGAAAASGLTNDSPLVLPPPTPDLPPQIADVPPPSQDGFAFHSGGIVGATRPDRYVHPAYYDSAPRFHQGLASDEFPAILQRGERVLTEKQDTRVLDLITKLSSQLTGGAPPTSGPPQRGDFFNVVASGEHALSAHKYHGGGLVGSAGPLISVPASLFTSAPRFHAGDPTDPTASDHGTSYASTSLEDLSSPTGWTTTSSTSGGTGPAILGQLTNFGFTAGKYLTESGPSGGSGIISFLKGLFSPASAAPAASAASSASSAAVSGADVAASAGTAASSSGDIFSGLGAGGSDILSGYNSTMESIYKSLQGVTGNVNLTVTVPPGGGLGDAIVNVTPLGTPVSDAVGLNVSIGGGGGQNFSGLGNWASGLADPSSGIQEAAMVRWGIVPPDVPLPPAIGTSFTGIDVAGNPANFTYIGPEAGQAMLSARIGPEATQALVQSLSPTSELAQVSQSLSAGIIPPEISLPVPPIPPGLDALGGFGADFSGLSGFFDAFDTFGPLASAGTGAADAALAAGSTAADSALFSSASFAADVAAQAAAQDAAPIFLDLLATFHRGGIVGSVAPTRLVHPAYFDDAPRFHSGLNSDEFTAILQHGQRVLTQTHEAQMKTAASKLGISKPFDEILSRTSLIGEAPNKPRLVTDPPGFPAILQRGERILGVDQQVDLVHLVANASGSPMARQRIVAPPTPPALHGDLPRLHSGLGGSDMVDAFATTPAFTDTSPPAPTSMAITSQSATPAPINVHINANGLKNKADIDYFGRTVPQQLTRTLQAASLASLRNTGH